MCKDRNTAPHPAPSPSRGEGGGEGDSSLRPQHSELIYGRRPVWEVLRVGRRRLSKLWVAADQRGDVIDQILQLARERGVPVQTVSKEYLNRQTRGHHQGVAAQVSATTYLELEEFLNQLDSATDLPSGQAGTLVLGLDEIEDPQNVGAILRNAGFFGVAAVMVPKWRSAPVGETALRASAGAAEYVPLIRVHNVVQAIDRLKESNFEVVGADASGEPLRQHRWSARTALILGSEGRGLRRLVKEHCDKLVGIPARTPVSSLNVGSAAAIFLYEFFRSVI